jgi:hypothetical protein
MLSTLPVSGGHTILDEVGSIASAVSYTHVAINVDFSSIRTSVVDTKQTFEDYDKKMGTIFAKHSDLKALTSTQQELMNNRGIKLNRLTNRLDDIQNALPKPDRFCRGIPDVSNLIALAKTGKAVYNAIENSNLMGVIPSITEILARGVFGNFLSIFSPLQLGTIKIGFSHMIDTFTSHDNLANHKEKLKKTTSTQSSTTVT